MNNETNPCCITALKFKIQSRKVQIFLKDGSIGAQKRLYLSKEVSKEKFRGFTLLQIFVNIQKLNAIKLLK